MRQDPQTAAPGPPSTLAAKPPTPTPTPAPASAPTHAPALAPTPAPTPVAVSTQPSSHIVVLTSVGQSILSQDGVKLILADDGGARGSVRPLHHHKAAILQHHHQQQLQQQQVAPPSVVVTKGSVVERRHPALGSMLQKSRMKLVYTKQQAEGSGDSSFASTSTSLGSTVSIDTSDDGGEEGSKAGGWITVGGGGCRREVGEGGVGCDMC